MGLGIGVGAPLPKGVKSLAQLRGLINGEVGRAVTDPVMKPLFEEIEDEDSIGYELCPLAEPLEFVIDAGRVYASAKTSTLGPGYHAEVVELVDRIGKAAGLAWNWKEDGADETGFAVDRDFAALQQVMTGFLRQLAVSIHQQSSDLASGLKLNMSMDTPTPLDASAIMSAAGAFDAAWFDAVRQGKDLAARAQEFLPWWSREHTPAQWARLTKAMMWSEVAWHPPCDEREERLLEATLDWAKLAGPELCKRGVSNDDLAELRELSKLDPSAFPPLRAKGFGFRRGLCRWDLGAGWTITLPGNVYQDTDEEDGSLVLFYSDWAVRLSVMMPEGEPDPSFNPSETIEQGHAGTEGREVVREQGGGTLRLAKRLEPDEEGETLLCSVAGKQSFVICTITFADAADLPWAIGVLRSISNSHG